MPKRGPSIDQQMMGPEPNFHGVTLTVEQAKSERFPTQTIQQ